MKHLSKFAAIALAVGLWSCSDEAPAPDVTVPEQGIPVRLTLDMPTASRSATVDPDDNTNSDAGFEIGQDDENTISSILVVLASREGVAAPYTYKYVAAAQADATSTGMDATNIRPSYVVRFRSQTLVDYVNGNGGDTDAGAKIYVFAYCNPSASFAAEMSGLALGDEFTDKEISSNIETIWAAKKFLMTNRTVPAPKGITTAALQTATKEHPIELGTVEVQRAAVRFDFKEKAAADGMAANQYGIKNTGTDQQIGGYVTLDGLALFNMAKSMYYLERVSTSPTWTPAFVCEREWPLPENATAPYPTAWVVSTGFDIKNDYSSTNPNVPGYFDYPTSVEGFAPQSLTYDPFPSTTEDKDENWTPTETGYYIWRYATENTIPGSEDDLGINNQKHGITTGVLFRGNISAVPGSDFDKLISSLPEGQKTVLYMYDNKFYTLATLIAAYNENPNTMVSRYFKEMASKDENAGIIVFSTDENGAETAALAEGVAADVSFKKTVKGGIAIYRPDAKGNYPCYYYYYNRHNDNGNNIQMGAMEFATVRNNVYKLKVSTIAEFGHPGDPGDDPDPEDPDDPDESPKTYFKVDVQVLPWVVRLNNIDL